MTNMINHLEKKLKSAGFNIFDISVDWGNEVSFGKHFIGAKDPILHVENHVPTILYYPDFVSKFLKKW